MHTYMNNYYFIQRSFALSPLPFGVLVVKITKLLLRSEASYFRNSFLNFTFLFFLLAGGFGMFVCHSITVSDLKWLVCFFLFTYLMSISNVDGDATFLSSLFFRELCAKSFVFVLLLLSGNKLSFWEFARVNKLCKAECRPGWFKLKRVNFYLVCH